MPASLRLPKKGSISNIHPKQPIERRKPNISLFQLSKILNGARPALAWACSCTRKTGGIASGDESGKRWANHTYAPVTPASSRQHIKARRHKPPDKAQQAPESRLPAGNEKSQWVRRMSSRAKSRNLFKQENSISPKGCQVNELPELNPRIPDTYLQYQAPTSIKTRQTAKKRPCRSRAFSNSIRLSNVLYC